MYHRTLVPASFKVPSGFVTDTYELRMLTIDDVDLDFEAVVASRDRLLGLLDPDSTWPDGLTVREDLIDLAWHHREFTIKHSFAYTLISRDGSRCLGCCYLFPSNAPNYDVAAFYWVRSGDDADARDQEFGTAFRLWLQMQWPFRGVAFPGRDIDWDTWKAMSKQREG